MGHDSAYEALGELTDVGRWAFGTGFVDPFAGLDTSVPDGVDPADLAAYALMLGDDALVMSHRLQQWLTRAPELEEETALANLALDLLGQARLLLTRAGHVDRSGRDEDAMAYLRSESEFRNVRLVEPADRDFAELMVRLLVFSTWRLAILDALEHSRDPVLAAVAARGRIEVAYHRDHAALWVKRLGDGTDESRRRLGDALASIAPFVPELFQTTDVERRLASDGIAVDPRSVRPTCDAYIAHVVPEATVRWPRTLGESTDAPLGRHGRHSEAMGPLLDELQGFARAHGGASW